MICQLNYCIDRSRFLDFFFSCTLSQKDMLCFLYSLLELGKLMAQLWQLDWSRFSKFAYLAQSTCGLGPSHYCLLMKYLGVGGGYLTLNKYPPLFRHFKNHHLSTSLQPMSCPPPFLFLKKYIYYKFSLFTLGLNFFK